MSVPALDTTTVAALVKGATTAPSMDGVDGLQGRVAPGRLVEDEPDELTAGMRRVDAKDHRAVWRERGRPVGGAGHTVVLDDRAGSYKNHRPPRVGHDRLGDRADQEPADTAEATAAEHQHLRGLRLGQQPGARGPRDHVRADAEVGVALDQPVHGSAQSVARPVPWDLKLRQGRVVTRHSFPGVHKTQGPPAQQGLPRRPVRGGQALGGAVDSHDDRSKHDPHLRPAELRDSCLPSIT
ncbi:hypothetical protein OG735_09245 [Streptomyces sp. NBC_01210]|nr:hypothetical protein OG735_09245 [Streptomyces sp. NBC_01210]